MKINHSFTLSEKELIEEALSLLENKLKETTEDKRSMNEHHKIFDIQIIRAYLRYDTSVTMTKKQFDNFTYVNGVDFPMYTETH